MSNTAKIIISILALVALIWGITALTGSEEDPGDTATTTPDDNQAATVPEGWEEYENEDFDFTLSHPPEAQMSTEAGQVKVQVLGEDNEPNTEVTDGITGYINTEPIAQEGLETTANQVFTQREANSQEIVSEVESSSFAERSGYTFQLRNQLGSVTTYHILPASEDRAYIISYTASGSDSESYVDTMETIASTLSITAEASAGGDTSGVSEDGDDTTTDDSAQDGNNSGEDLAQACEDAGGDWLAEHNECEDVAADWCEARDGNYNRCASACRHDPNADMCTTQCVQVCSVSTAQ